MMYNQNKTSHGWSPAGALVRRGESFPSFALTDLSATKPKSEIQPRFKSVII
jgi:hypothetical protein